MRAKHCSLADATIPLFLRFTLPIRTSESQPFAAQKHAGFAGFAPPLSLYWRPMSEVTQILVAIERGESQAAEKLLPLVYDELRKLAAAKLAQEQPGQTLQATALVHE